MELLQNKWSCTDADNMQFCLQHSDNCFTYREAIPGYVGWLQGKTIPDGLWQDSCLWNMATIDYNDLSEAAVNAAISGYYDSLEEVKSIYPNNWMQIVIECHFEQNFTDYKY